MKTRTGSTRGSVLVMVVGLLTIIAMLGSVFLLVARLNRRTAEALDAAAPDSLVAGIVDQVKAQMLADLNCGVYDDKGTPADPNDNEYLPYRGGEATAAYADFPGEGNDAWLASNYTASVWTDKLWPHITNISGEPDNAERKVTGVAVNHKNLRDTDSDGLADAILYRMEVFNSNGDEYCAAVRVIDLGGLICVNTGGEYPGTTPPAYTTPVWVNLKGFLNASLGNDTIYDSLNGADPDGAEDNIGTLWTNLASHPSAAGAGYTNFGVGDEMYLRWLTSSTNASTFTGPLYDATRTGEAALPIQVRRFLTTQGASRNLLRRPRPNLTTRIPLRTTDFFTYDDGATPENEGELRRAALYELLSEALGGTDDAKITAAHFVANLWAYMDGQSPDKSYGVEVTGHSNATDPIVYGVVPQPFITEVFAYNLQDSTPADTSDEDDDGYASAIELYNPSTNEITLEGKYQITKDGGTAVDFPAGSIIPANGRFVIYHVEGKFDHDNNASTARITGTAAMYGIPTTNSWDWGDLDFRGGTEYKISHVPVAGTAIQVDSVKKGTGEDIDFTATNGLSGTELMDVCRDDSANNRYALRASTVAHSGAVPCASVPTSHTLNAYNNLTVAQIESISYSSYYRGFSILESRPNGAASVTLMSTVADVMKLFIVGPIDQESLVTQLTSKAADRSRGYANELSATTLSGTSYPAVPFGCALGELFTVIPLVDPSSDPIDSRVYGRLNINTATKETLLMLPWPDTVNGVDLTTTTAPNKEDIVNKILEYRDATTPNVFTTPGQLAAVLGTYFDDNLKGTTIAESDSNYLEERGKLYKAVADLITVNSDVYAITMRVNLEDTRGVVKYGWNYISVIDRGSCFKPSDTPSPILPADKVK